MPAKRPKILVVDDEPHIRTLLKATLGRAGYSVVEAANAREALSAKSIDKPDLVLLDLGLPDRDGLEVVAAMRAEPRSALIVVSAREQTEQKVAALDLGADDYVTKPFDTEELLARVRASLRQRLASEAERQVVDAGPVSIDLLARTIRRGSEDVHVTPKEWELLAELAKRPGRVLTHEMLLRSIWGPAHVGQTEYLRVAIRSLRQKLEETPSQPKLIVNEPGVGYRLMAG
ncbi:MAG TPA: response regulator transcription factor [Sphingomicrobium sp.]|jgi:two-component system KDP operon response regulator KdpE|nr:response regulator transcription factor [Sphingomicrobium sp.]